MFTDAMDFMAKDISDKIGEMEHVIDSTTGMLADLDAKNGVANIGGCISLKSNLHFSS